MGTIEVFLFAENRLLREALTRLLAKKSGIRVVGASAFSADEIQNIVSAKPHVVVWDSATFAPSCLHTVQKLRKEVPGIKVVTIGMDSDSDHFLSCVRAGVSGYVLKDASAGEIAEAIRVVAYEGAVCPPNLCLALFEHVAKQSLHFPTYYGSERFGLSRREQQLIKLISLGLCNKEIATNLNLSEQTVKNHVHRILGKLGTNDRLAAVELCRARGMCA